jgi:hypothetical protein
MSSPWRQVPEKAGWASRFAFRAVWTFLFGLVIAACNGQTVPGDAFQPPTLEARAPLQTPTASPASAAPLEAGAETVPAPTPACQDGLAFLEDLTIPDGTQVAPGQSLDKRWRVSNSGSCNWDAAYRLRLLAGPDLGAGPETALYPAVGGTEAVLRILFTAPSEPGRYRSAWQAYNPQGLAFGDPVFVEVEVGE